MSLHISRRIALARSAAFLAAPVFGFHAARAGAQANVVHVMGAPFDGGAESFYASDMGFFTKAGLNVEVTLLSAGPAIMAAVASGTIAFGASNVTSLAIAHEKGLPLQIVAAAGTYDASAPTAALIVSKTSTLQSAAGLVGKTIAVNALSGIGEVAGRAWLEMNHVDPSSVHFIELPFAQMDSTLDAGRIEAAVIEEPALTLALSQHSRVFARAYDAIGKRFDNGAWFCTADYVKAHPDVVRTFARAIAETAVWANKNHDQSAKILEKYSKVTVLPEMRRVTFAEHLRASEMQPLIDASARYGVLKSAIPAANLFAPGAAG
jgi:NitT/TauT family transport system substrate-binding protein